MKKVKAASKPASAKKPKSDYDSELRKPTKLKPEKKTTKNWKKSLLEEEDDDLLNDDPVAGLDEDFGSYDSGYDDENDEDRY